MHLVAIGKNARDFTAKIEPHLDAAGAHRVAGDIEGRSDDIVDRDHAALGLLLTRHCEERAHDPRAALGGRADFHRRVLRARPALFFQHDCTRHHNGKRVVQFMGDTGQQRTQRGQLLALV